METEPTHLDVFTTTSSPPDQSLHDIFLHVTTDHRSSPFASFIHSVSQSVSESVSRHATIMQPKEIVNFNLFLSEWSRCLTAKYQRDQLYRMGKFDDCHWQWEDVKTAFWAKLSRDEAYATKQIQSTYYHKRTTISPTDGIIWNIKETPSWS